MAGIRVVDTHKIGDGFPDIVAWTSSGWLPIEIKNPDAYYGRAGLTPAQQAFHEECRDKGLPVAVVTSPAEALRVCGVSP
jgi:hypothetical protein